MRGQKRVLITDGVHLLLPEGLKKLGYTVDYEPAITLEEVRQRVGDYEAMVINSKIWVDEQLLSRGENLRWIGRLGSGLERIDLEAARRRNVEIISSPAGNAPAVGEYALALLLGLATKLRVGDRQVRTFAWDREAVRGWELKYKTVGIIGYGHTGPAFARVLRGFENEVIAYDKYKDNFTAETPWVHAAPDPETVFREADILSLHLPLTPETINYLNADRLRSLRRGAVVINTSRGQAVDLNALVEALENGQLSGAGLDVFPNEKPDTYSAEEKQLYRRLAALDNVLLSPHVAGWTVESKRDLAAIILRRVEEIEANAV